VLNKAFENILEKNASGARLLHNLVNNKSILKRLAYTFNDEVLEKFLEAFLPSGTEVVRDLGAIFRSLNKGNLNADKSRENCWCALIELCLSGGTSRRYSGKKVVEVFAAYFSHNLRLLLSNEEIIRALNQVFDIHLECLAAEEFGKAYGGFEHIQRSLETIANRSDRLNLKSHLDELDSYFSFLKNTGWIGESSIRADFAQLNIHLLKFEKYISNASNEGLTVEDNKEVSGEILKEIDKHLEQIKSLLKAMQNKNFVAQQGPKKDLRRDQINFRDLDKRQFDNFSTSDKIYVENAGLVLLWPFLNRFFENLGLLNDKVFVDESAAEKACLLLQYLADGQSEEIFEAHLPLNKVLCGIELEQPVSTQWAIDAEEAEACNNFINAVISNAPLWKNLSLAGFRQAYLKREGALGTRDGNWLLQVKREAYDVMIDKLPWPIQVVRLPWMEHVIFVEWQKV
ncbi:MAG TPA: contractile injection system tape measure protein, partial [Segetibacter sp.]